MRAVSAGYRLAAVGGNPWWAARLTVVDQLLQPVEVFESTEGIVLTGSVSVDRTRTSRRQSRLELINPGGIYTPRLPADLFYLNRLFLLERALLVGGGWEWDALGVYVTSEPEVVVTGSGSTVSLQGTDRTRLAQFSGFTEPYTVSAGTAVAAVVRALAQDAGMGASDALYALDDGGAVLGTDVTWEPGQYRLAAMAQLATDHGLELYCNTVGVLVLRPVPMPDQVASSWAFTEGEDATMLGLTRRLSDVDPGLFNHTLVSGGGPTQRPPRGEARDLNPASPLYNPPDGSGPIGDRLAPEYTSSLITTPEQADLVAQQRLAAVALVGEQITLPALPLTALEEGDVISVVQAEAGVDDRYQIETMELPLGEGSMALGSRQVRSLAA